MRLIVITEREFLCFGVIPHQWIVWADSDLGWRKDRFLAGPGEVLSDLPFDIPYTALRDSVVVILHVIFVAGVIVLWSKWQKRGEQVTEALSNLWSDPEEGSGQTDA